MQLVEHYFRVCLWGCFQKILAFESVEWVRKICPRQCGWTSCNQLRTPVEQKGRGRANTLSVLELGSPSSTALKQRNSWFSGLEAQAELQPWLPWVFSSSQQILGFLSVRNMWASSYNKSIWKFILLVLFLWRTLTNIQLFCLLFQNYC